MNGISVDEHRTINTSLIAVSFRPLYCSLELVNFSPQAIDTGTSLIYVPDTVADDFYAQVSVIISDGNVDSDFPAQIPGSSKITQFGPSMDSLKTLSYTVHRFHRFP